MDKVLSTWNLGENPQDIFITEENFSLTPKERDFINFRLEKIQNLAPAFSTLHFSVRKRGHFFFATLNIYANQNHFQCQLHHKHLNFLTRQLEKEMTQQLNTWKGKRFQEQGARAQ